MCGEACCDGFQTVKKQGRPQPTQRVNMQDIIAAQVRGISTQQLTSTQSKRGNRWRTFVESDIPEDIPVNCAEANITEEGFKFNASCEHFPALAIASEKKSAVKTEGLTGDEMRLSGGVSVSDGGNDGTSDPVGSSSDSPRAADDAKRVSQVPDHDAKSRDSQSKPSGGDAMDRGSWNRGTCGKNDGANMYKMLLVDFLRRHAQADDRLAKVMDQCGINVLESDCMG